MIIRDRGIEATALQASPDINRHIARCRRRGEAADVLVARGSGNLRRLARTLRVSDSVAVIGGEMIAVFDSSDLKREPLERRLRAIDPHLHFGWASFPDEALTLEGLIDQARSQLMGSLEATTTQTASRLNRRSSVMRKSATVAVTAALVAMGGPAATAQSPSEGYGAVKNVSPPPSTGAVLGTSVSGAAPVAASQGTGRVAGVSISGVRSQTKGAGAAAAAPLAGATGNAGNGGSLPFTGLDLALLTLGGVVLMGVGLVVRHLNRTS